MEEEPELRATLPDDEGETPEDAKLNPDLTFYWSAWVALYHDRHVGDMGGKGGIFYTAISRYAADFGIQPDQFSIFHALVRALDSEYLDWVGEKQKAEEEERKRKQGKDR